VEPRDPVTCTDRATRWANYGGTWITEALCGA